MALIRHSRHHASQGSDEHPGGGSVTVGASGWRWAAALLLAGLVATSCGSSPSSSSGPAIIASGQIPKSAVLVGGTGGSGQAGSTGTTVPLAKQNPTTAFFTAIGVFMSCLKTLGVSFVGAPNASDPSSPANNPTYLKNLTTCAARSDIVQALKAETTAQDNLTPKQVAQENKGYLKWRTCMISHRGWVIPQPKPDAKGALFSFGGSGGGGPQMTPPPGQSLFSSPDIQACTACNRKTARPDRTPGGLTVSRRNKVVIGVALAVVVVGAVVASMQLSGGSTNKSQEVIILSNVQRRTLQSTVALSGTLGRKELRNVTAAAQGLVSAVYSTDDSTTQAGQAMFAINGRDAIAETGTVPFFRSLAPGDEGADVLQLKQILLAAGDDPGPMTDLFTEQTQFALAQWQAQHNYPNSTPASPQSVTVALSQGTGYKLGDDVSAGLIIGPPAPSTTASQPAGATTATLTALTHDVTPLVTPMLTIQSEADEVSEGAAATFVITASAATGADITVNLTPGGTADDSQDIVTPAPTSVVLPANDTSVTVSVQSRANTVVEPDPTITMTIAPGSGYAVGPTSSAQTTIKNNNVPALQITGGTTVSPGGAATLTVTADQAPFQDTQVELESLGECGGRNGLRTGGSHPDADRRDHIGQHHHRHPEQQGDRAEQIHRGVHRPVLLVQRGSPGLRRDHHHGQRCRSHRDPEFGHDVPGEGPAL